METIVSISQRRSVLLNQFKLKITEYNQGRWEGLRFGIYILQMKCVYVRLLLNRTSLLNYQIPRLLAIYQLAIPNKTLLYETNKYKNFSGWTRQQYRSPGNHTPIFSVPTQLKCTGLPRSTVGPTAHHSLRLLTAPNISCSSVLSHAR